MDASPRNASPALQNGEKGLLLIFHNMPIEACCSPFPDIIWELLSNLINQRNTKSPNTKFVFSSGKIEVGHLLLI